jgi:hypothetical protein
MSNTVGVLLETGTAHPSRALGFIPGLSDWVRVANLFSSLCLFACLCSVSCTQCC